MANPRDLPDGSPVDITVLREPTQRNALQLKALLTAMRQRARQNHDRASAKLLTSKALIQRANLTRTTELHLARLGTVDKRMLDSEDHRLLVDYLWTSGFIDGSREIIKAVQTSADVMYHALASWLGAEKPEIADLAVRAEGRYRYWCPWGVASRFYATGVFEVRHDAVRQTLTVHKSRPTPGTARQGEAAQDLEGFLYGNRVRMLGLLSDRTSDSVSFLSLTGVASGGRFVTLSGISAGYGDGEHVVSPLYAEACDTDMDPLAQRAEVVPAEQTPWLVRERIAHLRVRLNLEHGYGARSVEPSVPEPDR